MGHPHLPRFVIAAAAMVVLVIGAGLVTGFLIADGALHGGKAHAEARPTVRAHRAAVGLAGWKPSAMSGTALEKQIVTHVEALSARAGHPLPPIKAMTAKTMQSSFVGVAVGRKPSDKNIQTAQVQIYTICNTTACHKAITPATEQLLQREAFELSYYTLRYSKTTQEVIVPLPPVKKSNGLPVALAFSSAEMSAVAGSRSPSATESAALAAAKLDYFLLLPIDPTGSAYELLLIPVNKQDRTAGAERVLRSYSKQAGINVG